VIKTGIALAIPEGMVGLVCPRSGLALNHGITVLNSPGVIDSDYRGELMVILMNHGSAGFNISIGDRIAQLLITPVMRAVLHDGDDLSETERGSGGFGSTGR
jgi:dUTP pyrophosphatase